MRQHLWAMGVGLTELYFLGRLVFGTLRSKLCCMWFTRLWWVHSNGPVVVVWGLHWLCPRPLYWLLSGVLPTLGTGVRLLWHSSVEGI